jgi:hypothetical protein
MNTVLSPSFSNTHWASRIHTSSILELARLETPRISFNQTLYPSKTLNWFLRRRLEEVAINPCRTPSFNKITIEALRELLLKGENRKVAQLLSETPPDLSHEKLNDSWLAWIQAINNTELGLADSKISEDLIPNHRVQTFEHLRTETLVLEYLMCYQNARHYVLGKKEALQGRVWIQRLQFLLGVMATGLHDFYSTAQYQILTLLAQYDYLLALHSSEVAPYLDLIQSHKILKMGTPADSSLETCPVFKNTCYILFNTMARYHLKMENLALAQSFADLAISTDPHCSLAHLNRARILLAQGKKTEFENAILEAMKLGSYFQMECLQVPFLKNDFEKTTLIESICSRIFDQMACHDLTNRSQITNRKEKESPCYTFLTLELPRLQTHSLLTVVPYLNFEALRGTKEPHKETLFMKSYLNPTNRLLIHNTNTPWPPGATFEYFLGFQETNRWIGHCYKNYTKLKTIDRAKLGYFLHSMGFDSQAIEILQSERALFETASCDEFFFDFVRSRVNLCSNDEESRHSFFQTQLDHVLNLVSTPATIESFGKLLCDVMILFGESALELNNRPLAEKFLLTAENCLKSKLLSESLEPFEMSVLKMRVRLLHCHLRLNQRRAIASDFECLEKDIRTLESKGTFEFHLKKELLVKCLELGALFWQEQNNENRAILNLEEAASCENIINANHINLAKLYEKTGSPEEAFRIYSEASTGFSALSSEALARASQMFLGQNKVVFGVITGLEALRRGSASQSQQVSIRQHFETLRDKNICAWISECSIFHQNESVQKDSFHVLTTSIEKDLI